MVGVNDLVFGVARRGWVGFTMDDGVQSVGIVGSDALQRGSLLRWVFRRWRALLGGGGVFLDGVGCATQGLRGVAAVKCDADDVRHLVYGLDGFEDGNRELAVQGVLNAARALQRDWSVDAERLLEMGLKAGVVYNRRVGDTRPKVGAGECGLLAGDVSGYAGAPDMLRVLDGSALVERMRSWSARGGLMTELVRNAGMAMLAEPADRLEAGRLAAALNDWEEFFVDLSAGAGEVGGLGSLPAVLRGCSPKKPGVVALDAPAGFRWEGLLDVEPHAMCVGLPAVDGEVDGRLFHQVVVLDDYLATVELLGLSGMAPKRGWWEPGEALLVDVPSGSSEWFWPADVGGRVRR